MSRYTKRLEKLEQDERGIEWSLTRLLLRIQEDLAGNELPADLRGEPHGSLVDSLKKLPVRPVARSPDL
jgi:hypothetical protein